MQEVPAEPAWLGAPKDPVGMPSSTVGAAGLLGRVLTWCTGASHGPSHTHSADRWVRGVLPRPCSLKGQSNTGVLASVHLLVSAEKKGPAAQFHEPLCAGHIFTLPSQDPDVGFVSGYKRRDRGSKKLWDLTR